MVISQSMPIIVPESRLHVVVGILCNADNHFFIQQRLKGKPREGQWEFPGGKVEKGESALTALSRELNEELGIRVDNVEPLTHIKYDYDHAYVWLEVFKILKFQGEVNGREGQNFEWCSIVQIKEMDVLEAVFPILEVLG